MGARNQRDITSQLFTVTNFTERLSLNCNANDDLLTADVLATLIQELKDQGIIDATIS